MGKTQKPCVLVVFPPLDEWEEIKALEAKGHHILRPGDMVPCWDDVDVILGPKCWLMDEQHRQYLELALKNATKRRYK